MNIDEAIRYFMDAENEGYYAPSAQELSMMSEEEIIKAAETFGEQGDYYAQEIN